MTSPARLPNARKWSVAGAKDSNDLKILGLDSFGARLDVSAPTRNSEGVTHEAEADYGLTQPTDHYQASLQRGNYTLQLRDIVRRLSHPND